MAKILTRARSHAVEYRADAGEQFAQAERLGEIFVGAEFQPDHSVDLVAAVASRDDDRNVSTTLCREAGRARHPGLGEGRG